MKRFVVVFAAVVLAGSALAQTKPAAAMSDHAKKDITRHRAMAAAHEAAAKCLQSGKTEEVCQKELQGSGDRQVLRHAP